MKDKKYNSPIGPEPQSEPMSPMLESDGRRHGYAQRVPMLTLMRKDRSCKSFSYTLLLSASLDRDGRYDTIELDFGSALIRLSGVNLETIYKLIVLHEADLLSELDEAKIRLQKGGVVEIIIENLKE